MPASIASSISRTVLLVPLKIIWSGRKPARSALKSSPPLLTSQSMPASRTTESSPIVELAFDA
jgi:hypothetical protein